MSEYIDKGKAIARFEEIKKSGVSIRDAVYLDGVMAVLDTFQTEDVSPVVHAKWERYDCIERYRCSACKKHSAKDVTGWEPFLSKYCPNCGAKMDLTED